MSTMQELRFWLYISHNYGSLWTWNQNMCVTDLPSDTLQLHWPLTRSDSSRQTISTWVDRAVLYCRNLPWPTDALNYYFQNKGWMNPGPSTWTSCFSSSRHTSGLIGDVCQTRQAASKFGQSTIGEQLVYGSGFSHSPCGDHRHRPEQSAAAGTGRAQDRTLGLTTNRLGASCVGCCRGQVRSFGDDLLKTEA